MNGNFIGHYIVSGELVEHKETHKITLVEIRESVVGI